VALLKRVGVEVSIPEVMCCGLPAASYGVLDQVQLMARENVSRLERERFEAIVVDDSSCGAHIKEYGKYLIGDPGSSAKAQAISQKTRELSSYLLFKGLKNHLAKIRWAGGVVAYHDPCKAQYAQKMVSPPRELLGGIPGLKVAPVKEADQCCGGGGTYSFVHPEMSQQVLAAKIKNIQETGCAIVVTSSVSCLIQLAFGLRKANSSIQALHLSEFLERALTKKR
jgi:glycolate oxidase iron-sulfur subunit